MSTATIHRMFVDNGFSIERICRALNLDRKTVCRELKADYLLKPEPMAVSKQSSRCRKTPADYAAVIDMRRAGVSLRETARRVGYGNHAQVCKIMKGDVVGARAYLHAASDQR